MKFLEIKEGLHLTRMSSKLQYFLIDGISSTAIFFNVDNTESQTTLLTSDKLLTLPSRAPAWTKN